MYDSGYASSKKRATNYGDDTTYIRTSERIQYQPQPTAFLDRTPERSPYRPNVPQGNRIQSARRSINEAIQLVSDKKRMNQEAIGEVRGVNQEIVSSFRGFNDQRPSNYDQRQNTYEHRSINEALQLINDKRRMNQDAIEQVRTVNQQILGSLTGYNGQRPNNYDQRNTGYNEPISNSYDQRNTGYNELRPNTYEQRNRTPDTSGRANYGGLATTSQFQIRPAQPRSPNRNEQLIGSTGGQDNNAEIRNRLNEQLRKNNEMLRYISTLESQNTELRSSYQGPNMNSLIQQNRSLRNQLANASSNAPYNLIEELQRLKHQNNELRKETVTLIKTKQYH